MLLWYFWIYSFLGYLLEKGFAKVTRAAQQGRKGFLLLPLCPVYGLGMLAVLSLPRQGIWLAVWGGFAATAVEYAVHWGYEKVLRVHFWDYSHMPGNLRGRVCLPFALLWGVLTALAVHRIQPGVEALAGRVPPVLTLFCAAVCIADGALSFAVLRQTRDPEALRCDRWREKNAL